SEEAIEAGLAVHVAGGKHEDAQAHAGHDQHEDRRERIELIAPLDVQQRSAWRDGNKSAGHDAMLASLFRRHRCHFLFELFPCFPLNTLFNTMIDADCAARNPVETKTILTREIRLGPLGVTAESIRINRSDAD